jgi:hypothetical protein
MDYVFLPSIGGTQQVVDIRKGKFGTSGHGKFGIHDTLKFSRRVLQTEAAFADRPTTWVVGYVSRVHLRVYTGVRVAQRLEAKSKGKVLRPTADRGLGRWTGGSDCPV